MNKHKQKIDKALMDYFLNPHFDNVATKKEKEKAFIKKHIDYFLNPHFDKVATKKEKDFIKKHFEIITIK